MIRLLCFLQIILSLTTKAQDTLAVVEPKYSAGSVEVFFMADTMFLRMPYDAGTTARRGSLASLYVGQHKVSDLDLSEIGRHDLFGIKRYGDDIFYYAFDAQAKKTELLIYRSGLNTPAILLSKTLIDGLPAQGIDRGSTFLICMLVKKGSTVNLHEFDREKLVSVKDIKIPLDLKKTKDNDIQFFLPESPERVSAATAPLKLFLNDKLFAAVFDQRWKEYETEETQTLFKTTVFRKDMVTGKEDLDVFFSTETFTFKSYLSESRLYRLVSSEKASTLTVHDLDNNKVVSETVVSAFTDTRAFKRNGAERKLESVNESDFSGQKAVLNSDLSILVDKHRGRKVVTIGYTINYSGVDVGPLAAVMVRGVLLPPIMIGRGNKDLSTVIYKYLAETADSKFEVVPQGTFTDFTRIAIDEFERLYTQKICAASYHVTTDHWVVAYKTCGSPQYAILRFNKNHRE
jgi:hypothetical protein